MKRAEEKKKKLHCKFAMYHAGDAVILDEKKKEQNNNSVLVYTLSGAFTVFYMYQYIFLNINYKVPVSKKSKIFLE